MYLQSYINSLIEKKLKKQENIIEIDLILDGGAFNGVYMLGALFFLKELEKRKVVKIKRISGCSVGALLGCLYALDRLDIALYISNESFISFRKYQNLKKIRKKIFLLFYKNFQDYDFSKLNGKFYLTYFDTKNGKQCLVKNYKCLTDVTDSLFKSMHVPFLIDGNTKYKYEAVMKNASGNEVFTTRWEKDGPFSYSPKKFHPRKKNGNREEKKYWEYTTSAVTNSKYGGDSDSMSTFDDYYYKPSIFYPDLYMDFYDYKPSEHPSLYAQKDTLAGYC